MFEFKLPDLGEGVHEGEVLKWHVKPGDAIAEDDALVDIETDKAAVSIPSPKTGKVVDLTGEVGDTVYVGNIIAVIETGDGAAAAPAKQAPAAAEPVAPVEAAAAPVAAAPAPTPTAPPAAAAAPAAPRPGRVVPAAPATRRLAREMGIDISQVAPSGPGGRVTAEDLKAFADGGAPLVAAGGKETRATAEFAARAASAIPFLDIEPLPDFSQWGPVELEPLRSIRRKVAHKMTTSMILVPHVAHMDDADVTALEEYREREKERLAGTGQSPPTLLAFMIKAVTAGLMQAPSFNASLDPFEEQIVYKKYYNIGIAVDSGRGLIVPVLKDVDQKSILDIAGEIRDLATRAREGKVEVNELRGGTFTITNVGPLGGTALIPTINYPEVAILGMGKVQEKPVVRKGEIVIRKILPITLAFDHRIADGADAARFVGELIRQLGDPLHWLVSKT